MSFDPSGIWVHVRTGQKYIVSPKEVDALTTTINSKFGGILPAKVVLKINNAKINSKYIMVAIKDHLCALVSKLGQGAFGKVYRGYDFKIKKLVAIKSQPLEHSAIILKQARITRDNGIGRADPLVNLGPSFLSDRRGYFVLPLADICFEHWVIQKAVSGENKLILKALSKVCKDLISLHNQGRVHMDLKLDNILVLDNIAYLGDFGKVESENTLIKTAIANHKNYPHCAPEYFIDINAGPYYKVSRDFDKYSFGYVLELVSRTIRDLRLKKELHNISMYIHCFNPGARIELFRIQQYLDRLAS